MPLLLEYAIIAFRINLDRPQSRTPCFTKEIDLQSKGGGSPAELEATIAQIVDYATFVIE